MRARDSYLKKRKKIKRSHTETLFSILSFPSARAHTQKKKKDKKIENLESKREIN
jgi:hypothetical protein